MKRDLFVVFICVLIAFAFVSCVDEPKHEHSFGEWQNSADLKSNTRECSVCHEIETRDGIAVTPENAQELINSVNTGKVYFTAGEYGDLSFLQGKAVSYARKDGESSITSIKEVESSGVYHYYRFINDMELIGESGVVIKGSIGCHSAHRHEATDIDPITGDTRQYYTHVFVEGLTISGLVVEAGQIRFSVYEPATVRNVTIKNCEFIGNNDMKTNEIQAMDFDCDNAGYFENIVITDNVVSDYFQGFHGQCVSNITITGCDISGTKHNALAIQSSSGKFSGNIIIKGNTISNIGDRAIRFNEGTEATISVSNNTFANAVDGNQLLKSGTLTNCTYSFKDNTYNGKKLADVTGNDTTWIVTIE